MRLCANTIQMTIRLPMVATMTMTPNNRLQMTWRHQGSMKEWTAGSLRVKYYDFIEIRLV